MTEEKSQEPPSSEPLMQEKDKSKSEIETLPESKIENDETTIPKVAERLRFFFSNANLRIDKFLRNEVLREGSNGFVTIETLLKFNTIKNHTTNPVLVAKAVSHELCSSKLQLNKDQTSIARCEPFTKDMLGDNIKFTLRVSNIPVKGSGDDARYDFSRDDVKALFEEFGYVALVKMQFIYKRNGNDNNLRRSKQIAIGKAFVEFENVEDMEKAAAELTCPINETTEDGGVNESEPKRTLKLGDNVLRVKTMQQWMDKRKAKREGGFKGKRVSLEKDENKIEVGKKRPLEEETKKKVEVEPFTLDWKKGCVISIKGLSDDCDREAILASVSNFAGSDVKAYADYSRGLKDGAIRFFEPFEKISEFAAKLSDGSITICNSKVGSAYILEGEEEESYYNEYIAFKNKQILLKAEEKQNKKKQRFGGRRGGRKY